MEIYLDANATTPVIRQAREAALAVMSEEFGNPSSIHGAGLRARALLEGVRARARRVIGAPTGQVLFTSGATEGIQTAVLSALQDLHRRRRAGRTIATTLLYGATDHKAVPEALAHWNDLIGLNLQILAIPVGRDGRHDLDWLRARVGRAGLVCTMAANNETGVISELDGIAGIMKGSDALWLVDGVQALGKLPLRLIERGIDYAPFSGHKLYAPKGVGMLYIREGAPFTPLLVGGGQEGALRSGTENMAGIAALGAVLQQLESGDAFANAETMHGCRELLADALRDAFPGVVFNAPFDITLPTTLSVSVPGVSARTLLDLLDAGGIRASGGSACGAAKANPSHVLQAMGLPAWQAESAVRLSFGAADRPEMLREACRRLLACGRSLQAACQGPTPAPEPMPAERITRFVLDGSCCYVVADPSTRECVIIDPLPELTDRLSQWLRCRGCTLAAVLDTHSHADHASSSPALRQAVADLLVPSGSQDRLGWPEGQEEVRLGAHRLTRLAAPGHTDDSTVYLLSDNSGLLAAFVGDTVSPGALGRSDLPASAPMSYGPSLQTLAKTAGRDTLLLPAHDHGDRFATTLAVECDAQPLLEGVLSGRLSVETFAMEKGLLEQGLAPTLHHTVACGAEAKGGGTDKVQLTLDELRTMQAGGARPILVDVREAFEQQMSPLADALQTAAADSTFVAVPLSVLINQLPKWKALQRQVPLIFCCRSGGRSAQAARALRRLGHAESFSLAGGFAWLTTQAGPAWAVKPSRQPS